MAIVEHELLDFGTIVSPTALMRSRYGEEIKTTFHATEPEEREYALGSFAPIVHLPAQGSTSYEVARLLRMVAQEVTAGRFESALDLTALATTVDPGCIEGYLTHAELQMATERTVQATALIRTISKLLKESSNPSHQVTVERLLAHAHPTATNIVTFANRLLETEGPSFVDQYAPVAVDVLVSEGEPELALRIAEKWCGQRSQSDYSFAILIREYLRNGQVDRAAEINAGRTSDADSGVELVARLAVCCATEDSQQWTIAAKLWPLCQSDRLDERARGLIESLQEVLAANGSFAVHRALLDLLGGNFASAEPQLKAAVAQDGPLGYLSALGHVYSLTRTGHLGGAVSALRQVITRLADPVTMAFAQTPAIRTSTFDLLNVGQQLADRLSDNGNPAQASAVYRILVGLAPSETRLKRGLAEALGQSGQRDHAMHQLEMTLAEQDKSGDFAGALETIRAMLRMNPGEARLHAMLIDRYLKRGLLVEALEEMFQLAQIHERMNRRTEAVAQLRRASEIAAMAGDRRTVDRAFRHMFQLTPDDLDLRHSAITAFIECGQIMSAVQQLWEVVRIGLAQQDTDAAIAALHQIVALTPHDIDAYHKLGEILASIGEYAQAERVYRRLGLLLPDDPAVKAKQSALAALARDED